MLKVSTLSICLNLQEGDKEAVSKYLSASLDDLKTSNERLIAKLYILPPNEIVTRRSVKYILN